MVDNVGLIHMGGRVYDPKLGRFLSVDPVIGDLTDSQSVHPYAYAGNRPLNTVDPSGLFADGPCMGVCVSLVAGALHTAFNFLFGGSDEAWLPNATAIPGPSAQGGAEMCGPGNYSPSCTGMILYAGAPAHDGGPGTSSWVNSSIEDPYAQENLERFFVDLGLNAIDVLILSPVYGMRDGYQAAQRGEHLQAVVILSLTACEVAKPCYALKGPLKGLARASKNYGARNHGVVIIGETMARVQRAAANVPNATILDDMPDFRTRGDLRPDQVTSKMMQYNRRWILDQLRSGRRIIDIGSDPNRLEPSIFYEMEKRMRRNYEKLHTAEPEVNAR
jgi:RHS repeat-associated protein